MTLFSEELRVGWWLMPEIVALAAIIVGCVQIAKSPLAAETSGLVTETASTVLLSIVNRLGDLERAIMEVLWQTDSALTVRQVSNGLPQSLAHTTVMTVLDRLAKKGFARRERDGRAWRYRPAATREAYVAELMLTALAQTGDRDAALARFAQSVSGAEAEVLREALSGLEREQQENETEGDSGVGLWGHWPTRYFSPRSPWEACRCARAMMRASLAAPVPGGRDFAVAGTWPGGRPRGRRRAARRRRQRPASRRSGVLGGLASLASRLAYGQLVAPHQPVVLTGVRLLRPDRRASPCSPRCAGCW